MQKCINFFLAIFFISTGLLSNKLTAQSVSYELIGNYDSDETISDTIKLTPYVPDGYKFCRFEFDVTPDDILVADELYTFPPNLDAINVTLYYTLKSGDCSDTDPNLTSAPIKIYPKRAFFTEEHDFQLDSLGRVGSLIRVFKNSLGINDNDTLAIGNFRFYWTFDKQMVPKPEVDFKNPVYGQFPNVYYTFPNGGEYEITLKVVDVTSSYDTACFTRILDIDPVFGSDAIDFQDIPNVFTPNKRPYEHFIVKSSGTRILSFTVFSRSGAMVYEYKGNVIKWDGKNYYGTDLPQGVYYYIIQDIDPDKPKKYNDAKGFFYIYR
ncbi:MAG: gliding motility-associated C-terminal domain-containing protein [Bacteroidales bacterium]|nr:gliding motility-associated C-terminal domain-containing protein [Bacteroidales bacterium]MDD4673011.1 gliding motility-associated C-terminal domain-containing protein [Bacteroidales bacterium]